MGEIGKYIFGIINSNTAFRFFIPRDFLAIEKGRANEVYAILYKDISAVVSESETIDYTHMFKDALARLLVGHQKVIERVMGLGCTIIPMKLGTFAIDEDEVKDILNKGYGLVKEIIQKINDKVEIDVVSTWGDFTSVIKEAGEENEVKEFKEKLLVNPKGITVDDQMKVGVMVKKALEQISEKYAFKIQDALKAVSDDFKQHDLMDDKMVINSAFLIDKAKQEEFYAKIEDLNIEFAEKLNFRCVGPLPPYSFFTLEVKKMQYEEIDWARKKLGLVSNSATKSEIKKAYQAMAFALHPDKNPNTPGIEREFDEVIKAYKTLWEYCQGESCSFDKEEFKKNSILVKVKE